MPNRDSADYRLDDSNLFFVNQYQGRDNLQNNQRVNFGLDNYLTSDLFGDLDFFIGQSYRVGGDEDNTLIKNPNRQSDIINNLNWQINNNTNINWKYLIDNDTLEENYSNLSLMTKVLDLKITSSHSSINNNFTDGNQDREEFNFKVDKKFGNNWKLGYSSTYDMSNNDTEKNKRKDIPSLYW